MDHYKIKEQARVALVGNRLMLFILLIIVFAVASIGSTAIGIGYLVSIILGAGVYLTVRQMLLDKKQISIEVAIVTYFKDLDHGLKILVVGFLYDLLVAVGICLFIIPGVYWGLKYSQAVYIMADHKDMTITDAFKESGRMMEGYKSDLLYFYLGFIGHFLLGIITLGIYFLYFMPYLKTCTVNYYLHLSKAYSVPKEPEFVEAQF